MTPTFCSLIDTKQSLQYTIKTHVSGPPMPKFKANMNYIPPRPPSSMKQCNKTATVKFHKELLLILRPGSNLAVVRHYKVLKKKKLLLNTSFFFYLNETQVELIDDKFVYGTVD